MVNKNNNNKNKNSNKNESKNKNKNKKAIQDILLNPKLDRRILANVPDKEEIRNNVDRRGRKVLEEYDGDPKTFITSKKAGIRYFVKTDIKVICKNKGNKKTLISKSIDISTTGILLELKNKEELEIINRAEEMKLEFEIPAGSMPEGYEMKVKVKGNKVREINKEDGSINCAIEFKDTLA